MLDILSIQSHVAYGYVGNRAAVFPLQRLGFDVTAINTVQFSNHTGYGSWQGDVMSAEHIEKIMQGLRDRDVLNNFIAVLSGYMGDVALGKIILDVVAEIKQKNPQLIYCCDPVMGDVGRGFFVREGIPQFFKEFVIPQADIITPNKFEAEFLSDMEITTMDKAVSACQHLSQLGSKIILITSLEVQETQADTIQMLVYSNNEAFVVTTPKFMFETPPNGSGDMTAAIFLGDYLKNKNLLQALSHVASSVFAVFKKTFEAKTRELQLIQAQDEIAKPVENFSIQRVL